MTKTEKKREGEEGGPQKDRGKQGGRERGRGNKAGDREEGRATVSFNEDLGDEIINSWAYLS